MIPVAPKGLYYPDAYCNLVPLFCANPSALAVIILLWGGAGHNDNTTPLRTASPTGHQLAAHKTVVALLSLTCACMLALHQLRCRVKRVNDLYLRLVGVLLRPHEIRGLPGAFWFVLGATLAVAIFPRDVALQRCGMRGAGCAGPSVSLAATYCSYPIILYLFGLAKRMCGTEQSTARHSIETRYGIMACMPPSPAACILRTGRFGHTLFCERPPMPRTLVSIGPYVIRIGVGF